MHTRALLQRVIPATLALAFAASSAAVFAQDSDTQQVNIQGAPMVTTQGWARNGIRNQRVQLSQNISYADLNLATHSGASELKARVRDAASAICTKLSHFDDGRGAIEAEEDQVSCVNGAVDDAMAQIRQAIESAEHAHGRG
jgi:UrcA family protein